MIWIDLNMPIGHEQAGRRPALVLSDYRFNVKTRLAVICPITSKPKGIPLEVTIPEGQEVSGVVLAQHVRSVDLQARNAAPFTTLPAETVAEVLNKVRTLLD